MKYNPNIHHRRSIRLKGYDYSQAGAYFVTINTHQSEALFGEIAVGEMQLNDWGQMVTQWWNDIPNHFPHADIDEFIIMPNHIHGIIFIFDNSAGLVTETMPLPDAANLVRAGSSHPDIANEPDTDALGTETVPLPDAANLVRAGSPRPDIANEPDAHALGTETIPLPDAANFVRAGSPRPDNTTAPLPIKRPTLGQIVAYFKYQSTKHINLARVLPGVSVWHRNYYEHIIRNELGLHNVRHYIANNPAQWSLDNENPARTK